MWLVYNSVWWNHFPTTRPDGWTWWYPVLRQYSAMAVASWLIPHWIAAQVIFAWLQPISVLNIDSNKRFRSIADKIMPKLLAVSRIFLYCIHSGLLRWPLVACAMMARSSSVCLKCSLTRLTWSLTLLYLLLNLALPNVPRWRSTAGSGDISHHWPVNRDKLDRRWYKKERSSSVTSRAIPAWLLDSDMSVNFATAVATSSFSSDFWLRPLALYSRPRDIFLDPNQYSCHVIALVLAIWTAALCWENCFVEEIDIH